MTYILSRVGVRGPAHQVGQELPGSHKVVPRVGPEREALSDAPQVAPTCGNDMVTRTRKEALYGRWSKYRKIIRLNFKTKFDWNLGDDYKYTVSRRPRYLPESHEVVYTLVLVDDDGCIGSMNFVQKINSVLFALQNLGREFYTG